MESSIMDNKTLETLIKNEAVKVFDKYNQLLPHANLNVNNFEFNFKLKGRVAGKAWYSGRRLSFNLLLAKDNLLSFLNETVPHEVAHLYQMKMNPDSKPHGQEWKYIMNLGGYDARRCHNYDMQSVKSATKKREIFEYICGCGTPHKLTKTRHNRVMRGTHSYVCKKCHQQIRFVKKWTIE